MELYGQEPEAELLASFLPHLSTTYVIDAGAERGAFAEAMLDAGSERVDLIEPAPDNLAHLRERFSGEARAIVHGVAAAELDGEAILHLAARPDGSALSFGHTMLERPGTKEIEWTEQVHVEARSLASLVSSLELPAKVGLLKIDAEGNDLAVVRGMGQLDCDVVMVEHWRDLPHSLGPCPWSTEELVSTLAERGFSQFAFLLHRDEIVTFRWGDATVADGEMGNVVFLRDRVVDRLTPLILSAASRLAVVTVERLRELRAAAEERRALLEATERERDLQATAAAERLVELRASQIRMRELEHERDLQAAAAAERLVAIEKLTAELEVQSAAAEQRLASMEILGREHGAGDPPRSGWS